MAFRSKRNGVLADSSAIGKSRLQLSPAASSTSPLFTYPPASASFTGAVSSGSTYTSSKKRTLPCKSEKSQVNAWLEAMKASSPPRSRSLKGDPVDESFLESIALQYRAWLSKHPSALSLFDEIIEAANGKQVVVFLDYDGTLSPIVEDPERAFMSDAMRSAVKDVAALFPTSIITGRCRDTVYDFVQLPELYYAGSHGLEIMGPAEGWNGVKVHGTKAFGVKGNEVVLFQPASEFVPMINEVFNLLEEKAAKIHGAKVEHNKFCVSVHFRRVEEENWIVLAEQVQNVLKSYPNLCSSQGRKVLEIRPSVAWDKGKALKFLLKSFGLATRTDVFPIYIGDDRTDEDAFAMINKRKQGIGILVSSIAKETNATSSLHDPSEVMEFLQRLVKWRQSCMINPS